MQRESVFEKVVHVVEMRHITQALKNFTTKLVIYFAHLTHLKTVNSFANIVILTVIES